MSSIANNLSICRVTVSPLEEETVTYREETVLCSHTWLFTGFTANNLHLSITHRQLPGQAARNSPSGFPNVLPPRRWQRSLPLGPTPRRPFAGTWSLCTLPAWSYHEEKGMVLQDAEPSAATQGSGSKTVPICATPISTKFTHGPQFLGIA